MDCKQYQDALNAVALGFPSLANAEALDLHLRLCEGCRRELARRKEFAAALDRQMQAQLEFDPPADFHARLRRRVATESEHARRPLWSWTPILAGAASMIILLALIHYRSGTRVAPTANVQSPSVAAQLTAPRDMAPLPQAGSAPPPNRTIAPPLHPVALAHTPVPELKVRVDPREVRAAEIFESDAANGRINPESLARYASAQQTADQMAELTPVNLPPLVFPPLEQPALDAQP